MNKIDNSINEEKSVQSQAVPAGQRSASYNQGSLPAAQRLSGKRKMVLFTILAVVLLFVLVGLMFFFFASGENIREIDLKNNKVTINKVDLENPGYIYIYKDDNGRLGRFVGVSSELPKGVSRGIYIDLKEAAAPGQEYWIVYTIRGYSERLLLGLPYDEKSRTVITKMKAE
ncbi:MAG: hypothetical protein PVJ52_01550 [Candidatus Woesebacteria bacterium]|jgi:hypothetical protein